MRVTVDADRCEGHARCWAVCPEVFDLDDEGHAVVLVDEVQFDIAIGNASRVYNFTPAEFPTLS